jgi:DNA recombination-mediator protein A
LFASRLKEIYDPPLVSYGRGNPEVLTQPGIAMVGMRHPTPYGLGVAERLACDLTVQGLVIISGMARGVDTTSHRGTIADKGRAVAAFWDRDWHNLSERKFAFVGADSGAGGSSHFRILHGNIRCAAELSHP